jgi:sulfur carrier protein ThiS
MKVTVQLHTILQIESIEGIHRHIEVTLSNGCTLADLLDNLDIYINPDFLLLVVNGRSADLDQTLFEGDRINLMPAISGGDR